MRTLHRQNRSQGFSLLELVIVLAIIGVITAMAVPRVSQSDNTLLAQAHKLARDLRHVQAMAMNQGRTLSFNIRSVSSYQVTFNGNPVLDPATMQPYVVSLDEGVTLNGIDTDIDSWGRPVTLGSLLSTERFFTLSGDTRIATVILTPVTGFVLVSQ